jgi:hypothetical protein
MVRDPFGMEVCLPRAPGLPDPTVSGAPQDSTGKIPQLGSAIAALLAILESRLDRGELTLQDPIVGLAREHIDQAVALGVDNGYRKRLDSLLSGLAAPRRTPHLNGVLLQDEPPAIVPVVERRNRQAPVANDRRSGHEGRRFKRFVSPVLLVWIAGHAYRTMDWSIGGLMLAGSAGSFAPGAELLLRLRVEGLPGHVPFEDRALLVRRDAADGWFSLRFKSGTSATLKVLELLSRSHMSPAELPAEDGTKTALKR